MAAAGLLSHPDMEATPGAIECLLSILDISLAFRDKLHQFNENSYNNFSLRIGINVGPVIAGVIGARKPQYDIWGNTVNVASRMESTGVPGYTQVTQDVVTLTQHRFKFRCRGPVRVKGKGTMITHFLLSKRSTNSAENTPTSPLSLLAASSVPTYSTNLLSPNDAALSSSAPNRINPYEGVEPLLSPRFNNKKRKNLTLPNTSAIRNLSQSPDLPTVHYRNAAASTLRSISEDDESKNNRKKEMHVSASDPTDLGLQQRLRGWMNVKPKLSNPEAENARTKNVPVASIAPHYENVTDVRIVSSDEAVSRQAFRYRYPVFPRFPHTQSPTRRQVAHVSPVVVRNPAFQRQYSLPEKSILSNIDASSSSSHSQDNIHIFKNFSPSSPPPPPPPSVPISPSPRATPSSTTPSDTASSVVHVPPAVPPPTRPAAPPFQVKRRLKVPQTQRLCRSLDYIPSDGEDGNSRASSVRNSVDVDQLRIIRKLADDARSLSSFNSEISRSDPSGVHSCDYESEYDNYRPGMASDEDYFHLDPISDIDLDLYDDVNLDDVTVSDSYSIDFPGKLNKKITEV